ncbi:MAG: hypothetical protein HZA90_16500 [Verrucomicrobia bacterium]|nr:hypothetical protein [Verrucomicrobiota bacterium]
MNNFPALPSPKPWVAKGKDHRFPSGLRENASWAGSGGRLDLGWLDGLLSGLLALEVSLTALALFSFIVLFAHRFFTLLNRYVWLGRI